MVTIDPMARASSRQLEHRLPAEVQTPSGEWSDAWLWDGEFRAGDPALILMRKRQALAWSHAEMLEDEKELGQLWQ